MSLDDWKDMGVWETPRRKFLKILGLIGIVSSINLLDFSKKMVFGKEGDITPEEMRKRARQLFDKPVRFH